MSSSSKLIALKSFLSKVLPDRIDRSSSSILERLDKLYCFGNPRSPATYSMVDDPFLIPSNAHYQSIYLLCKYAGRRTAKFVMSKYPDAFHRHEAKPEVPLYDPPICPTIDPAEMAQPNEETLLTLVEWGRFSDAIAIYRKLLNDDTTVERRGILDQTKLAFFESLCAYNGPDGENDLAAYLNRSDEDKIAIDEEQPNPYRASRTRNWNTSGWADILNELMNDKNLSKKTLERMMCSLIKGKSHFGAVDDVFSDYSEMLAKQMDPCRDTFTAILESISSSGRFSLILENQETHVVDIVVNLLSRMRSLKIKPDLGVFNSAIRALSCYAYKTNCPKTQVLIAQCVQEMRSLGIKPSLATLESVLSAVHKNEQIWKLWLEDVLSILEKDGSIGLSKLRDPHDAYFFLPVLKKLSRLAQDNQFDPATIALRLHRILIEKYYSFGISHLRHVVTYYSCLLSIIMDYREPECVLPLWYSVVPNIISPSRDILIKFIEYMSTFELHDEFARFYSDLNIIEMDNASILGELFATMCKCVESGIKIERIHVEFANVVKSAFAVDQQNREIVDSDERATNRKAEAMIWTKDPSTVSNAIYILVKCLVHPVKEDDQTTKTLFDLLERASLLYGIDAKCLETLIEAFGNPGVCISVLKIKQIFRLIASNANLVLFDRMIEVCGSDESPISLSTSDVKEIKEMRSLLLNDQTNTTNNSEVIKIV